MIAGALEWEHAQTVWHQAVRDRDTAIARAHETTSVKEIAVAFGLSDQRVFQIIAMARQ